MTHINQNFLKLPGGYLFPEISRRVKAFSAQNPPMPLIKLGIGDVTRPLPAAVIEAMHKAVDEMGAAETFRCPWPPPLWRPWPRPRRRWAAGRPSVATARRPAAPTISSASPSRAPTGTAAWRLPTTRFFYLYHKNL